MTDPDTDVYRVGVDVVPDATGFISKLKAQVDPQAEKAGRDISERISSPIGRRIVAAIFGGVRDGGRLATTEAGREGESAGAAFGRVAKARITAALKNIPAINLTADATKAEATAARLRAELAALSARIEVSDNLDGEMLRIRQIKAELASLASQIARERYDAERPIAIDVDAGLAHAEIASLDREIREFQRQAERGVRVRADDDTGGARAGMRQLGDAANDAGRKISFLIAVGAAIGPAIVPGAAAAAAAVFAIGAAASGAVAGLAVLGLGFSGVVGAVQALSQEQESGGGSAGGYADKQRQVADAVERVHDAERNLGEQQRELVRVQEEVNQAREDAAETLERLSNSVEGGAISERQAVLDLERARKALAKVNASATASGEDRAQAQIDFDRAMLRLKEQRQENARNAAEKAEADAKGIEGSDQVVAAQERVRKQTQSVEQAQRDLARAQRDAADAAAAGAAGGGAAMDALKKKLDSYSPAMRTFAAFLISLKPQLIAVRDSVQGAFLPGVERAIRNLLPMVPGLTRFLTALAHTMGDLADETTKSLGSPVWQKFFAYIGRTAGPAITGMVHSVRNLAEGFVGLITAFSPVSTQVGNGIVSLTAKFAKFGATAATNPEFQRFLAYVSQEGPRVVKMLAAVSRALLHIAEATAPIGTVSLKVLEAFANVINAIPTPVLTVILGIIIATTSALKLYAIATTVAGAATKIWGAGQSIVASVMARVRDNTNAARTSTQAFGFALTEAAASATRAQSGTSAFGRAVESTKGGINTAKLAAGGLVSFLGGPWGIALAAGAVAVGYFGSVAADQEARVNDLSAALGRLGQAYKLTGNLGSQAAQDAILANQTLTRLLVTTKGYLAPQDIANAAGGDSTSQLRVLEEIEKRRADLTRQIDAKQAGTGIAGAGLAADLQAERNQLDELKEALEETFPAAERLRQAQLLLAASASQYASPAQQRLAELQNVLASSTASATEKLVAQKELNELLAQAHVSQSEALEALGAAVDGMTASVERNGSSLDENTAAGRENRDAVEARAKAIYDAYQADLAAGVGTERATYRFYEQIRALVDNAAKLGLNKDKLLDLVNTYGQVPSVIQTYVELSGYQLTHEQLLQLTRDAAGLADKFHIALDSAADLITKGYVITSGGNIRYANVGGHAEGGLIGGVGGPTSDSNIARVSRGEFVHQTAAVNYYGPQLMYALNARRIPRQVVAAGYATGGLVGGAAAPSMPHGLDAGGLSGYIPPGMSIADSRLAGVHQSAAWASPMRGYEGGDRTINIYPQHAVLDADQFRAQLLRLDTLDRTGRPT